MSDKRKFLIENFATIQKARSRKPRPLSYEKIADILSENGVKVSAQLVKAVCKDGGKSKKGSVPLDGAVTKLDGAARKPESSLTKPPSRKNSLK